MDCDFQKVSNKSHFLCHEEIEKLKQVDLDLSDKTLCLNRDELELLYEAKAKLNEVLSMLVLI